MMNYMQFSMFMFMISLSGFMLFNTHILVMLLMMEFMMLSLLLGFCSYSGEFFPSWLFLLMLFFLVCESVMGISSVILMSRSHGNEMLLTANMMLW